MNNLTPKRRFYKEFNLTENAKKPVPPQSQSPVGVFLGGACNPTTWRKDIAIPFLEKNRIPYFNPQVDEWRPELMAKEAAAKEQASCLLFVFQPHLTRGLASLVEVAYLAALLSSQTASSRDQRVMPLHSHRPRLLLIVRPSLRSTPTHSDKKSDTITEAASIEAAYEWLEGLQMPNVRFFELLEDALQCINQFYSKRMHSQSPQSPNHSNWRRARKVLKSCVASEVNYNDPIISPKRLVAAYQCSATYRNIATDLHSDLYFGGAPPNKVQMKDVYPDSPSWIVSRQGAKKSFALSMAVQSHCSRLYFHISRTGLWIVEQMEAAFAIGSGKEVFLCIEYLSDDDAGGRGIISGNSSGYSSLASTPDENFLPPTAPAASPSASASSAPSRHTSSSEYEKLRATEVVQAHVNSLENDAVVKSLSKYHETDGHKDLFLPPSDVSGLSPAAVKDHNRSRSYLKSLFKEVSEESGKGCLLDRPVESISDLVDLL